VVEYEWDTEVPQDQRIHAVSRVISKCKEHTDTKDIETHYDTVKEENVRKNVHLGVIADNFPELTDTDEKGNKKLKEDAVSWSFDKNRVLQVTVSGMSASEKETLKTLTDAKLGIGKVKLN
jgi:Ran GTPase-activating protein (RanGAP) involved in mRNA processing and transport